VIVVVARQRVDASVPVELGTGGEAQRHTQEYGRGEPQKKESAPRKEVVSYQFSVLSWELIVEQKERTKLKTVN
jgi:hypothetical protein